ncbi:MAG: sugar phosphate isomerase/epimerase [Chitinophagaceae bacterium]|nr:sugar phosphate isomerase/epimerase [Chitinophagaceae bacterium]
MNQSRKDFLRNTMLLVGATAFAPKELFASEKKKGILGIQLYSVRDQMKTDPQGTLMKLANMGYQYVEHANYISRKFYGYSAAEFKKLLDGMGLKMFSGHTVMTQKHWDAAKKDFTDDWKYTVEDAATAGQQYVISPWLDESLRQNYDDLLKFLDLFNKTGELCKRSGMKFGYHNHDFEFKYSLNGQQVYDIILQHTDPKLVFQQLDIGNMYNAGAKAKDILQKYPGRFLSLHVKDEIKATKGEGYESTILGAGVIPVKEVIDLAKSKGGTSLFIIEQESYQGKDPVDSAKEDLAIMKKWGY